MRKKSKSNRNQLSDSNMVLSLTPVCIYWKDQNGRYLGCNHAMAELISQKDSDIIGQTDQSLSWLLDSTKLTKLENCVTQTKKTIQTIQSLDVNKSCDHPFIITISPIFEKNNVITGTLGHLFRITNPEILEKTHHPDNKKTLEQLSLLQKKITGDNSFLSLSILGQVKRIKDHLENIIALTPGNLYWKDKNGIYLGCNDNMAKLAGLSRQEIIGKTDYELTWKKYANTLRENDLHVMESGETLEFEEEADLANGQHSIAITNKRPLYDEHGNIIGVLGTSIDITEMKRLEKQLHEAELKAKAQAERIDTITAIGASIAHELRTPLRAIINNAQFKRLLPNLIDAYKQAHAANLDVKPIRSDQLLAMQKSLEGIETEASYANSVIDMLLMNIKEMKDIERSFQKLQLAPLIQQTLERYPWQSETEKTLAKFTCIDDFAVLTDQRLITQILFNLIRNSLFYIAKARKGKIQISIKKDKKHNLLIFEDTATGIEKGKLSKIFEPFFTDREMGTGLGLSFCKMAMDKMGGAIRCESEFGQFTRFILSFPKQD